MHCRVGQVLYAALNAEFGVLPAPEFKLLALMVAGPKAEAEPHPRTLAVERGPNLWRGILPGHDFL